MDKTPIRMQREAAMPHERQVQQKKQLSCSWLVLYNLSFYGILTGTLAMIASMGGDARPIWSPIGAILLVASFVGLWITMFRVEEQMRGRNDGRKA